MSLGTLVFSHANSYPAGCYRVLFERWRAAGWRVEALDRFGHDPRFPVTGDWRKLRDQLLHFIDTEVKPEGQVALVGHSLGGMGLHAAVELARRGHTVVATMRHRSYSMRC